MMGAVEHWARDERCAGDERRTGDERRAGDERCAVDERFAVERCLSGDVLDRLARSETTSAARRNASPGGRHGRAATLNAGRCRTLRRRRALRH